MHGSRRQSGLWYISQTRSVQMIWFARRESGVKFATQGDLARLSSSHGAATSRLSPPECPSTFAKPLSARGPSVGLLGRVRASRARAQNTAPAFARFARETEPGVALRLEGAERKSLS